jgi:uncharacterized membrane protein
MTQTPVQKAHAPNEDGAKNTVQLVYILQGVGFFVGVTWIAGVIVNHVKRGEAAGSWVDSHFRWQIRTFWFGLLWGVVGALLSVVVIGLAVLVANYIWMIYRVVKGWLDFSAGKAMYQKDSGQPPGHHAPEGANKPNAVSRQ